MSLPEEMYSQSVIYCTEEEEWKVNQEVKEYERCRSVCIAYKKSMQTYCIMFLTGNFVYLLPEHFIKYPIIAAYLIISVLLVIFRKNLVSASLSSLILILLINKTDTFSVIPLWVLFAYNAILAYLHREKQKYIISQHGYPDFRPLTLKVIKNEHQRLSNADEPLKMEQLNITLTDIETENYNKNTD